MALNPDLMIINDFGEFSQINLKNFIYNNRIRKYKFENIPKDFNDYHYKILNEDLTNLSKIQLYAHYENQGFFENGKYKFNNVPNNFNCDNYKILNEDLKHLSNHELILHYENQEFFENRIFD